jgi:ABC-type anion transport system duplicated permease subunit
LPRYATYSLARITLAYGFSLAFTLVYGHIAAYNSKAERFMIPVLDILQSIPVLSFLPGLMLAMIALLPHRQLGIELGTILLIFTGQVWNMAFSFYSSLKSIPREMRETARIYRFSWWQRFADVELPFAAIGLVWNSMMSVAGGWFFLMACEMFVLGSRDFRLPGLGSYLQTAASAGDTTAILWGIGAMIMVIVLLDQLVWRPLTRAERWRSLILPGIFPYLITGLVTASGGAWNASIVAEYFRFKGQTISTVGLGATISRATDSGNFNVLLAATCVMAAIVVVINRTVWRRLYALAETRFKV